MTVTVAKFQADFPEFATASAPVIAFWLNIAQQTVSPTQFGNLTDSAVELVTAHHVSLAKRAASNPASPGGSVGTLASKSAIGISASYDTNQGAVGEAGQWNMTIYGRQYWSLVELFGAGVIQLAGPLTLSSTPPPWVD